MNLFEKLRKKNDLKVVDWFDFQINYPYFIASDRSEVIICKESEKAVQIVITIETVDGEYEFARKAWVPKACFESASAYEEKKAQAEAKREVAFEEGCKRYEALISFCKANHVKGARVGLRTATLLKLIEKSGLTYNL